MEDLSTLLTDEFQEFAKKIGEIHDMKKQKQDELKKLYEKFKTELAQLDVAAKEVAAEWEKAKSAMTSGG